MNKLINLHFASEYSFFESPTNIKEYVEFAHKNHISHLVLTDHNYVFGFAEFKLLCEKYKIKPIYGIDLDVDDFRLILLAKNKKGFDEIIEFSYLKSKSININVEQIKDDNLYIINHPSYGTKNIEKLISKFNDFYFYDETNSKSNIFINDNRIVNINKEDALFFINELKGNKLNDFKSYLLSEDYEIDINLKNKTNEIANGCNVVFEEKKDLLPSFDNANLLLRQLISEGLNKNKSEMVYYSEKKIQNRIEYELSIIEKMKIENYFLIIADLINWSKKEGISIGPGRGSVSGSLIAFIIGITEINPLKYNLYFERFLNEQRISMPDIDIDIQDDRRDEVISYLKNKYGHLNLAQICTFQRMGAKQSLKDVGRFLNISFSEINDLSKIVSGSDTLEQSYNNNIKFKARIDSSEIFTKLFKLAIQIESLPRQTGIHAAGIVISKNPIINNCPIMEVDSNLITQFSMEHLEDWNLLKIDLLGLRTLTIIQAIENEIPKIYGDGFRNLKIDFDNEKVYKLLANGKVAGIFQLESPGMLNTIQKIKINKFNDLVDIISLFRPGPLSNIPKYIQNKNNPNQIEPISPEYDEVVKETHGIIIYQEQIMEIVQKVAKLSFSQADILRKGISKKRKEDIDLMKKLFLDGAIKNNITLEVANKIYQQIEKFAEYGFNKSHAVAYASLSYKMAYLKTKFPICFYSTIISLTISMDSVNRYVKEAKELKFNIESPSINYISKKIKHNNKDTIWLPLTFVKGIGTAALDKLLTEFNKNGKFLSFFNFVARAKKAGISDSIIDILIESNSLREFGNMNTLLQNKEKALHYAEAIQFKADNGEILLDFSTPSPTITMHKQNLKEESQNEIKYLGMIYNSFLTSKYETNDKLINLKIGIEYQIVLHIDKKKEILNKFKKMSYIVEVSDSTSKETIFFNDKNKNIFDAIQENKIGMAKIIKLDKNGKIYFYISEWKERVIYE